MMETINKSEISGISNLKELRARKDLLRMKLEKQEEEISFRFYYLKKNTSSILLNQFFPKNGNLNDKIASLFSIGAELLFNKISGEKDDSGKSLTIRIFNWVADKLGSWFGRRTS